MEIRNIKQYFKILPVN